MNKLLVSIGLVIGALLACVRIQFIKKQEATSYTTSLDRTTDLKLGKEAFNRLTTRSRKPELLTDGRYVFWLVPAKGSTENIIVERTKNPKDCVAVSIRGQKILKRFRLTEGYQYL